MLKYVMGNGGRKWQFLLTFCTVLVQCTMQRGRGGKNARKCVDVKYGWSFREQITSSTFAFDVSSSDPDKFVLIHSLNGKAYSTVTLWPQCNSFHLPFEVMGQVQGVSISILRFSFCKHGSDIVCLFVCGRVALLGFTVFLCVVSSFE